MSRDLPRFFVCHGCASRAPHPRGTDHETQAVSGAWAGGAEQVLVRLPELPMTHAGKRFEPPAVEDGDLAPVVADQAQPLELPRGLCDADAPHAHHPGEELVRNL